MGLDGYLCRRATTNNGRMLMSLKGEGDTEELAYWRKAYAINELFLGYNTDEYENDLNCKDIVLSEEDLKEILKILKKKFKEDDFSIEVVEKAINETDFDNEEVFYHAWW